MVRALLANSAAPAARMGSLSVHTHSRSYFDGEVDLVQTHAILRHLARRHGLAGASVQDAALVDVLLEGIADLKGKIVPLVYRPNLQVSIEHPRGCWG